MTSLNLPLWGGWLQGHQCGDEDGDAAAQLGALRGSGQAGLPAVPEDAKLFMRFSSAVWEGPRPFSFHLKQEGAGRWPGTPCVGQGPVPA